MSEYYMLNKPCGVVTACRDERYPTVMDCLPRRIAANLHPVGRLDADTRGILILTDDGELDQALLLPENHVDKEYFFYAIGRLDETKIALIDQGCTLPGTDKTTRPAKLTLEKTFTVRQIEEYLPAPRRERYMKNPDGEAFSARLIIREGKRHQVKRMMRAVDCRVCALFRTSFAGIPLDPYLEPGQFRPLREDELAILFRKKEEFRKTHPFVPRKKEEEANGPDCSAVLDK